MVTLGYRNRMLLLQYVRLWLVAMADQVVANFGLVSLWTSDQLRNLSKFNRRSVS